VDLRKPGFYREAEQLIGKGFRAIKIPAQRLITDNGKIWLTGDEMMQLFHLMQEKGIILSIDLADGATQVAEMEEIIAACPSLKIAIGHFGMVTRDGWQEQIRLARYDQVMIESGGITWLFNDEFYPFAGAVRAIREAISLVGIDKLMWGSDYPRTMVAITYRMSYDFIVRSSLLTDTEKALFLGLNAQKFYGFGALPEMPYIKNMTE
jgi:predicted TIM-barrel fold metal-dependent hydrolase